MTKNGRGELACAKMKRLIDTLALILSLSAVSAVPPTDNCCLFYRRQLIYIVIACAIVCFFVTVALIQGVEDVHRLCLNQLYCAIIQEIPS